MTLWISGVLVNTSSGQSGTNKKSHKTCQLCPAIILTPSEAEGVGDGGGDRVDKQGRRRMGDGFRSGVDRVETDRFGDDWRIVRLLHYIT